MAAVKSNCLNIFKTRYLEGCYTDTFSICTYIGVYNLNILFLDLDRHDVVSHPLNKWNSGHDSDFSEPTVFWQPGCDVVADRLWNWTSLPTHPSS